jgi:hypothetical protein
MSQDFADLIKALNLFANSKTVPPREQLEDLAESLTYLLNNENPLIRPHDYEGVSGGLILLDPDLPTLIVPDLHGRRDFMMNLLNWDFGEGPVLECLYNETLQVVCVGDGFHTEKRGALRWQESLQEFNLDYRKHKNMDREMADSFGVMAMVMLLKRSFPDNFHFLKGNHENIKNENNLSDRSFGKYANEGAMVRLWVEMFLGEDLLETYSAFEQSLPVFVAGDRFLISHAEPLRFHSRDEIINYRFDRSLVYDFSWTGNGQAEEGSVEDMFNHFIPYEDNPYYFGGHRPVPDLYLTRANGRYVQIHNPDKEIVALIKPGQEIDLDEIVMELENKEV